MLARISMRQAIHPHLYSGARGTIHQVVDPVPVDLGHPHAHG